MLGWRQGTLVLTSGQSFAASASVELVAGANDEMTTVVENMFEFQ